MNKDSKISLKMIDAIVMDFDGVLTNNKVIVNEEGTESVVCSRSDGIAFDAMRKLGIKSFVISSERNRVVAKRSQKLSTNVIFGSNDKCKSIIEITKQNQIELSRTLFVGNDINDYHAMEMAGYRACPNDSHPFIKEIANIVTWKNGGDGVIREILEEHLGLDLLKLLYKQEA